MNKSALFDYHRTYRWHLWREWDKKLRTVCFIMLNPSTADENKNDPTVERCQRRAVQMGFGSMSVLNIFAFRSTNPAVLYTATDPVGRENDRIIRLKAKEAAMVVCGWGNHGQLNKRGEQVLAMLREIGVTPHALKLTSIGIPWHPLYLPYTLLPFALAGPDRSL